MNNKITNKPSLLSTFVISGIAAGSYAAWKYLTRRSSSEDVIDEDVAIRKCSFDEDFITPRCSFDEDDITSRCTFEKCVDYLIRQEISRTYNTDHNSEHDPEKMLKPSDYIIRLQLLLDRNNKKCQS
jgi:hypothetical protein